MPNHVIDEILFTVSQFGNLAKQNLFIVINTGKENAVNSLCMVGLPFIRLCYLVAMPFARDSLKLFCLPLCFVLLV